LARNAAGRTVPSRRLAELATVASRKLGLTWPEIHELPDPVRAVCPVESLTGIDLSAAERMALDDRNTRS